MIPPRTHAIRLPFPRPLAMVARARLSLIRAQVRAGAEHPPKPLHPFQGEGGGFQNAT